jgi:hypothetical protein
VLELRADGLQDVTLRAGLCAQDALQLVDVQCQGTEALHLPQQRAHVGALRVALLNGEQVSAGERRLESHMGTTAHPYSVSAGQCTLPNFGQVRRSAACPAILERMEKRIDRLTAVYVDLAVNVATSFGLEAGMRVLQHNTPLLVVQRVLIENGARRGNQTHCATGSQIQA